MTPKNSAKPSPPGTIDLPPNCLPTILAILGEHVAGAEVRAFGSRVTGTSVATSDLDLVIRGAERLSLRGLRTLQEAFETSDLPIRVDVVDWHRLTDEFKAVIERAFVPMQ